MFGVSTVVIIGNYGKPLKKDQGLRKQSLVRELLTR